MSYSFTLRAATKALALAAIATKLDELVAQQPVHQVDRKQVQLVAETMVAVLPDDDTRDVTVTMNGHVSGSWNGSDLLALGSVSVGFSVGLVQRPAVDVAEQAASDRNTA